MPREPAGERDVVWGLFIPLPFLLRRTHKILHSNFTNAKYLHYHVNICTLVYVSDINIYIGKLICVNVSLNNTLAFL